MKEEEKSLVRRIHEESWKAVTEFFQKPDVELPFLYESNRTKAYEDIFASIDDSGIPQIDLPVPHSTLYFIDGKIIDLLFYLGGTVVPPIYTEKTDDLRKRVSITRENIRNFLRYNIFFYSFVPIGESHKALGPIIGQFEEMLTIALTSRVLQDVEADGVVRAFFEDKFAIEMYESFKNGDVDYKSVFSMIPNIDTIVAAYRKTVDYLIDKSKEFNPIEQWDQLLFSLPVFKQPEVRVVFEKLYNYVASKTIQFNKRITSGEWIEIKPQQDTLDGKIIYTP